MRTVYLRIFAKFLKTGCHLSRVYPPVHMEQLGPPLDGFSWNLIFEYLFGNVARTFKFRYNLTTITGTLLEEVWTFMIKVRWILLRIRNALDKSCRENHNTNFMFDCPPPSLPKIVPFMRDCWTLNTGQATDDNVIWRMRIAWWITKSTNIHSECVILVALPQQQCTNAPHC